MKGRDQPTSVLFFNSYLIFAVQPIPRSIVVTIIDNKINSFCCYLRRSMNSQNKHRLKIR